MLRFFDQGHYSSGNTIVDYQMKYLPIILFICFRSIG